MLMKKSICQLMALLVVVILIAPKAQADSYLYDLNDRSVTTPDTYLVLRVYAGNDLGVGAMSSPQDLFVDRDGQVYISDMGNNRILQFDNNFKHIRTITEVMLDGKPTLLNQPKGVFAANGLVYICDTGNARVLVVDEQSKVVRKMTREGFFAVNKSIAFRPEKVAADSDGNVFVVDRSIYQGIVQYNIEGKFVNFFAPNKVDVTASVVLSQMWKNLFSSQQVDSMERNLPNPYNNVYISPGNFLYTAAMDVSVGQELKCLNALGKNILKSTEMTEHIFGDREITFNKDKAMLSRFVDVHVDKSGIMCGADNFQGRLFLYDQNSSLIGLFGGSGSYKDTFRNLTAVDKLGDNYLVLDGEKNSLTLFKPTAYIKQVRDALDYYNQGLYRESVVLWEEVLKKNSHFSIAYRSIGRAYLQEGKYKEAMSMLKTGGDTYFYSLAFKEYRKNLTRKYFVWIILGTAVFIWGFFYLIRRIRCWILANSKGAKQHDKL